MRLLHTIIQDVSDKVNLPCVPIYARGEDGYNEQLDEAAGNHSRLLMFNITQDGTFAITGSLHGYLEYNATLMFLTITGANDTNEDIRAKISQMVQMAFEWLAWLRRDASWRAHFENNADSLRVPFRELDDIFDAGLVGVALTLQLKIDPFFDISNLC
jgi:hypothetical protein